MEILFQMLPYMSLEDRKKLPVNSEIKRRMENGFYPTFEQYCLTKNDEIETRKEYHQIIYLKCQKVVDLFPNYLVSLNMGSLKLKQIPRFPISLKNLVICFNEIVDVDVEYLVHLEKLDVSFNKLKSIQVNSNLVDFDCSGCKLTSLPYMPNLTCLNASSNKLVQIELGKKLKKCNISLNRLRQVKIRSNIEKLNINFNEFEELPWIPDSIQSLHCCGNQIKQVIITDNMTELYCDSNKIEKLPELKENLLTLSCSDNQIKQLPQITTHLIILRCENNLLTSLPDLQNVRVLFCKGNQITNHNFPKTIRNLSF